MTTWPRLRFKVISRKGQGKLDVMVISIRPIENDLTLRVEMNIQGWNAFVPLYRVFQDNSAYNLKIKLIKLVEKK